MNTIAKALSQSRHFQISSLPIFSVVTDNIDGKHQRKCHGFAFAIVNCEHNLTETSKLRFKLTQYSHKIMAER